MPERIQLKRTKGWRMPENTLKVDRTTRWGNPFLITKLPSQKWFPFSGWKRTWEVRHCLDEPAGKKFHSAEAALEWSLIRFACEVAPLLDLAPLRNKNLACWCALCSQHQDGKPLGVECPDCAPCHVDVLLELCREDCDASRT